MLSFRSTRRSALVTAGLAASLASCVAAQGTLSTFTSIENCTPFPIGLQVGSGDGVDYSFVGNEDLAKFLTVSVENGVLSVTASGLPTGKATSRIGVVVSAPKGTTLTSVNVSGQGDVSILGGFSSDALSLMSSGQGDITAEIDVSGLLTISSNGQGDVNIAGMVGSLDVTSGGQGDVDVFGVQGDAKVDMSGQGDVFILGGSDTVISGSNSGMGSLKYGGSGSCTVPSSFFGDSCVKSSNRSPEMPALPNPSGTSVFGSGSYSCGSDA